MNSAFPQIPPDASPASRSGTPFDVIASSAGISGLLYQHASENQVMIRPDKIQTAICYATHCCKPRCHCQRRHLLTLLCRARAFLNIPLSIPKKLRLQNPLHSNALSLTVASPDTRGGTPFDAIAPSAGVAEFLTDLTSRLWLTTGS
jgi:hypothetical protein